MGYFEDSASCYASLLRENLLWAPLRFDFQDSRCHFLSSWQEDGNQSYPLKWMEIQHTYLTRRLVRFSAIVTGQGVQREGSWESFKSAHPLRCDLGRKSQGVPRYEEERKQIFLKT